MSKRKNNKTIIAPRGMLGAGALAIKPFKKKIFLTLSKILKLYSNVKWQASTAQEANEIKAVFGEKSNVMTALNLPPKLSLNFVKRTKGTRLWSN